MMRWRMLRHVTWACKWRGLTWWLAESACVQTKEVQFFWVLSLSSGSFSSFSHPFLSIFLALTALALYMLGEKSGQIPAPFLQFQKPSSHWSFALLDNSPVPSTLVKQSMCPVTDHREYAPIFLKRSVVLKLRPEYLSVCDWEVWVWAQVWIWADSKWEPLQFVLGKQFAKCWFWLCLSVCYWILTLMCLSYASLLGC